MPATGTNGFPQFYGLSVYAWPKSDTHYGVAGIRDAEGKPLEADKRYRFSTISFLAEGGDGYSFRSDEMLDDHGDFFTRIARSLRERDSVDTAGLIENKTFLVFPDREQADAAWYAASAK
jgi:2',3'-cyclic-nucleotide 2'-phosphodiesterase (5'-nucleotidase family)